MTDESTTTRTPRSPRERAQEAADLAQRKYERAQERYEKSKAETLRLRAEAADFEADANFLASHPLIKVEFETVSEPDGDYEAPADHTDD